jgi:hypothetical protein
VKSGVRHLFVFVGSCIITAVAWMLFWPDKPRTIVEATHYPQVSAAVRSWTKDQIDDKFAAVRNASTDQARLDASIDLLEIPAEDVPEVLERMKSEIERDFSQVAQILVIRWASSDGEAAANWAWKSFRTGPQWENIFNQIGPAWAAHHPAGFYEWVLETAKNRSIESYSITLAEAESSERPLLDGTLLRKIPGWLITEDPHLAYKVILATSNGFYDERLPDSLASVSKVREALLAFDEREPLEATYDTAIEKMKNSLFLRWNDLDPEDFSRSSFADQIVIDAKSLRNATLERWTSLPEEERAENANRLVAEGSSAGRDECITAIAKAWAATDPDAAVRWLDSLPPENAVTAKAARISTLAALDLTATLDWADQLPHRESRHNSLVSAFDAWTKAHPGERADQTGWPAARVQAWNDLEALQPRQR